MTANTNMRRSKLFTGLAGVAALALVTGCAADDSTEETPADQEVEQPTQAEQTPTDQATEEDTSTDDAASSGDDAVYEIIDAVEAEYADGFIVDIDLDDNSYYDVEVVSDGQLYELEVTEDGSITADDQESDDDKIAKADEATVTVTEALDQAFDQHADATFDQIELDEDDGTLRWDIDLDGADNSDIELEIDATS